MPLNITGDSSSALDGVLSNIRRLRAVRKALKFLKPEAVISFIGTTNILAVLASRGLPMRLVISERNDPARQSLGRAWNLLRCVVYRYADRVTANTQGAVATLSTYVPREKLACIPNPVPKPETAIAQPMNSRIILAVGRLHRQKAFDVLIKAFAIFSKQHKAWRLEIAGTGEERDSLVALANERGVSDRVDFLGHVDNVTDCFRRAAFFVLPSRHEGQPNALLEAMMFGLPVIVTDSSPGPLEYVSDRISGLVTPVEDVEKLAEALSAYADDPILRQKMGDNGRDKLGDNDISSVMKKWDEVLDFQ